jgi:hypothetical protein
VSINVFDQVSIKIIQLESSPRNCCVLTLLFNFEAPVHECDYILIYKQKKFQQTKQTLVNVGRYNKLFGASHQNGPARLITCRP